MYTHVSAALPKNVGGWSGGGGEKATSIVLCGIAGYPPPILKSMCKAALFSGKALAGLTPSFFSVVTISVCACVCVCMKQESLKNHGLPWGSL